MHNFLRAVGFSNLKTNAELKDILSDVFHEYTERCAVKEEGNTAFVEYIKSFGKNMGIRMCGTLDTQGFHQEYYFPYFKGENVSSHEDLIIERRAAQESFSGVCEDMRMGVSIIFYVQNAAKYKKETIMNRLINDKISVTFSGLSLQGKILFPVVKDDDSITNSMEAVNKRTRMIAAARQGDTEAMESLTLEDIDLYSMISQRIVKEDVFSIIDTFFMPYGMECDQYQIMGNILQVKKEVNSYTKEKIYQMTLECNDMQMDVCINEKDLLGEPEVGRRFKGVVWLQGYINFPD